MRSRSASQRSFRPRVESLEGRALLSVCLVDRLTDVGEGKDFVGDLRYCIEQAQDGDSIQFALTGSVDLTRALPDLTRSISIEGPGANLLTVQKSAGLPYRIFTVDSAAVVWISGLSIARGHDARGGGIQNRGSLTIDACSILGNYGSGIFNAGTLFMSNSTIARNFAKLAGGIENEGTLIVDNSTISENTALAGGGIGNIGVALIRGSTITGNHGQFLGGGLLHVPDLGGAVYLQNTLLAGNEALMGPDFSGTPVSLGHNLIGNSNGEKGFDKTDLLDLDPQLGSLDDNGGPTLTHALLPGSPALDAGNPTDAPEWDQRGEGYGRIAGKNIDIGAYEEQGSDGPSPGRSPRFDVAILLADRAPQSVLRAGGDDGEEVVRVESQPLRSQLEFVERVQARNLPDRGFETCHVRNRCNPLHQVGREWAELVL